MLRAIREIRPRWVVGENVRGFVNWSEGMVLDTVCADLEVIGYEVQPFILPACAVGAPHRRDRIWIAAHRADAGAEGLRERQEQADEHGSAADSDGYRFRVGPCQQKSVAGECRTPDAGVACQADVADAARLGLPIPGEARLGRRGLAHDGRRHEWEDFPTQPPVRGRDDGLSAGLDGITFPRWRMQSIKAYGNAIVPQVFYQIAETINEYERI